MEIKYELTKDDIIDFNLYHSENSKTIKRSLNIQRYIISVIFVFAAIVMSSYLDIPYSFTIPFFLVVSLIWIFYYPKFFKWLIKRNVSKMLDEGKNKAIIGEQRLSISNEGIIAISEAGEMKSNWSLVEKIGKTKKNIYIYISSISAYIIPIKAFNNEEEVNNFISTVNKYIEKN